MQGAIDTIKAMHNSEINGQVAWFFDDCWSWKLGDEMNDFVCGDTEGSFESAVEAMAKAACALYPDSDFAKSRCVA